MKLQHILLLAITTVLFAQQRFDHLVRGDFFAGFSGNAEALERGMKNAEAALKENPKHAEALVWHGAGLFFQSSVAFRNKDMSKGMELYGRGLGEMSQAVALEPRNIGVRIPRAAVLSSAAKMMPAEMAKPLWESVIDDYYTVYQMQEKHLDSIGQHPKGELLFGMADTFSRIGATEKADHFYGLIRDTMPDTPYSKRAAIWFETKKPLPVGQTQCIGCHTGK